MTNYLTIYRSPNFNGHEKYVYSDEIESQYNRQKRDHALKEIGLKRKGKPHEIFSWKNPAHVQVYLYFVMGKCISVAAIMQADDYHWIIYIEDSSSIPEIPLDNKYVDLDEKTVERNSYYYKPYVVYKSTDFYCKESLVACIYSNQIEYFCCNPEKCRHALEELGLVKKDSYKYFSWKDPNQVQAYLSILLGKCIFVTAIMQACDYGDGYPYWMIYIQDSRDAECFEGMYLD